MYGGGAVASNVLVGGEGTVGDGDEMTGAAGGGTGGLGGQLQQQQQQQHMPNAAIIGGHPHGAQHTPDHLPLEQLKQMLTAQLEYYFSP